MKVLQCQQKLDAAGTQHFIAKIGEETGLYWCDPYRHIVTR